MTKVIKLIEYLQSLPKDTEVFVVVDESNCWEPDPEKEALRLDKISGNFIYEKDKKELLLGLI